MKLLKYLGAFLVAALGLFLFVVDFSAVETRFQCSGEISSQNNSQQATIFMKLHDYRWWVGLWSDSDGSVWLEVPNQTTEYFEHVVEVGDQLQIYDYQRNPKGYFFLLQARPSPLLRLVGHLAVHVRGSKNDAQQVIPADRQKAAPFAVR